MKGAGSSTVKMYEFALKKYAHIDIYDPINAIKQLESIETKKGHLSPSYIKMILSSFVWKIRTENKNKNEEDIPALKFYALIISHIRSIMEKDARQNKKDNHFIPDWNEIIEKRENEYKNGNMREHLILSLYTYIPPRRLQDFILMKFVNTLDETQDTQYNYYVKNDKILVFNVYKTAKTHKQQIIELPKKLNDIILNYIKLKNMPPGSFLIGMHNYLQLNYLLKRLLGCSVDALRHSYINHAYSQYDMPTNQYMNDLAYKMGHTLETNLLYRKF